MDFGCLSPLLKTNSQIFISLHVACGMGASTHVVELILNSYPEACILKTRKGSRPVKCINPKAVNKEEVKQLLNERKKEVDASYRPAKPV